MKKSTFFLIVILCSNLAFGQKYVPFQAKNAEWNVKLSYYPYEIPKLETSLLSFSLQGDTIIDLISYKKLCQNIGSVQNPVYVGVGGLRESDKKIYYIGNGYSPSVSRANKQQIKGVESCLFSENDGTEILLYDFNVKVGDTIHWGHAYNEDIIDKIDSILIGNSYRKCYRYKYNSRDLVIEGIGSVVNGLLGSVTPQLACGPGMSWEFVCFSQNGETLYLNPAFKDCNSIQRWDDIYSLKTNTQWFYSETVYPVYSPTIHYEDYNLLKSIGDTIINGVKCNILSHVRGNAGCASFESPAYVYQSNDTVHFYNSQKKGFSTLYVYGTEVGDSWTVEYPLGNVKVKVDSMSSVQALGRTLKLQFVTYSSVLQTVYEYTPKSTIIEYIGDINYFFQSSILQREWVCDEFGKDRTGLRCYVHPDYGTYKTGATACDFVTAISKPEYSSIKVYIASSGVLQIESEMHIEPYTFELIDLRGIVILKTELNANRNTVNIGNFSNGLYMYRLTNNGKLLKSGKIVKM